MPVPFFKSQPAPAAAFAGQPFPLTRGIRLNRLFLCWFSAIMHVSYSRPLEQDDIWEIPESLSAKACTAGLARAYYTDEPYGSKVQEEGKIKLPRGDYVPKRSLWVALLIAERYRIIEAFIMSLIGNLSQLVSPILTAKLINTIGILAKQPGVPIFERDGFSTGIIIVVSSFLISFVGSICESYSKMVSRFCRMSYMTALVCMISQKTFRLSPPARVKMTDGMISNLSNFDTSQMSITIFIESCVMPIKVILGVILVVRLLGVAGLVGLALIILFGPLQTYVVAQIRITSAEISGFIDKRLQILSEVLTSIRAVKTYAYERVFAERIAAIRQQEIKLRRVNAFRNALNSACSVLIPLLSSIITIVAYVLLGGKLMAGNIFAAWHAFNVLRQAIGELPRVLSNMAGTMVAIRRLEALLAAEESDYRLDIRPSVELAIDVNQASFRYEQATTSSDDSSDNASSLPSEPGQKPFCVTDVQLQIPRGSLTVIYGRVGTGKSTLISGILNHIRCTTGYIILGGPVTYIPQRAWVSSGTIRDNITLGQRSDQVNFVRLGEVIEACGLAEDLAEFDHGIMTEIGERGITLSGGQRQRICMARAAYHDGDIVVLDDPLSALDARVGHQVLHKCILSGPLGRRTRLLVTHQPDVLQYANHVIVMDRDEHGEGKIVQQGQPTDLLTEEGPLKDMVNDHAAANASETSVEDHEEEEKETRARRNSKRATALMLKEERAVHEVPLVTYVRYLRAIRSWPLAIGAAIGFVTAPALWAYITIYLGQWTDRSIPGWTEANYIGGFFAIALAFAIARLIAAYCWYVAGTRASATLSKIMLWRVLHAPTSWHDRTPTRIGRILNRFSKDIQTLDSEAIFFTVLLLNMLLTWLCSLVVMVCLYPIIVIIAVPMAGFVWITSNFSRHTSRESYRLALLAISNVQADVKEQLDGLEVLRSFDQQHQVNEAIERALDRVQQCQAVLELALRWYSPRIFAAACSGQLLVGLLGVAAPETLSPAVFAAVYVFAQVGAESLNGVIVNLTQVEMAMNCVERALEYVELETEETLPDETEGRI